MMARAWRVVLVVALACAMLAVVRVCLSGACNGLVFWGVLIGLSGGLSAALLVYFGWYLELWLWA